MKEAFKKFAEKKGIKKWFQRDNLIILVLSGVLLLIIALPTEKADTGDGIVDETDFTAQETTDIIGQGMLEETVTDDYAAYLEQRLEKILSGMDGVGDVSVMVTLKSSEELVVEKDEQINRSNTNEEDSEGGTRSVNQTDSSETTIYQSSGSDQEPYVIKTLTPKVEGVFIVAEGSGTGDINKNITEAVQALFGIEANKIKVVKMQKSK